MIHDLIKQAGALILNIEWCSLMMTFHLYNRFIFWQNDGEWLMAVEQGNDHVISVWQWKEDCIYSKSSVSELQSNYFNVKTNDIWRKKNLNHCTTLALIIIILYGIVFALPIIIYVWRFSLSNWTWKINLSSCIL